MYEHQAAFDSLYDLCRATDCYLELIVSDKQFETDEGHKYRTPTLLRVIEANGTVVATRRVGQSLDKAAEHLQNTLITQGVD
jgi:hypothetical protein